MKIIKVSKISLTEKDTIVIDNLEDFKYVNTKIFSGSHIFNLEGKYYLIGSEIVYIYNSKKK